MYLLTATQTCRNCSSCVDFTIRSCVLALPSCLAFKLHSSACYILTQGFTSLYCFNVIFVDGAFAWNQLLLDRPTSPFPHPNCKLLHNPAWSDVPKKATFVKLQTKVQPMQTSACCRRVGAISVRWGLLTGWRTSVIAAYPAAEDAAHNSSLHIIF